jgi:hypothetical protein
MEECKNRAPGSLEWNTVEEIVNSMSERERIEFNEAIADMPNSTDSNYEAWLFHKAWQAALSANQPEIDAPIHDNARMYESLAAETNSWTEMAAELEAANAENEKLRKDAERLNFIENPLMVIRYDIGDNDYPYQIYRREGCRNDREFIFLGEGETLRNATDAAMTAPNAKGE